MKKFSFSLDKVLSYKQQLENSIRNEHAAILQQVNQQEQKIRELEAEETETRRKLDEVKRKGCSPLELNSHEGYIGYLTAELARERGVLLRLKKQEEAKRQELIEAKKETASIDKLKVRKLEEYRKLEAKEQEQLVEEFVNHELSVAK
ncbi:MAG: flagellar export protein FliJ [Lachnospiraceae bacterium]|jgi:flagellar FliJ protein|nr:flagellar export protein FliJ [Lachnospiraceae bacterium]